jgi:aryl-alcohol dehydrogenase-like predicted oxidoreductase
MENMETRRLGPLQVSAIGLGCNNFGTRIDADETASVVDAALNAGITLLDTADVYGAGLSEEYIGRALRGRRDEAVIATKFGIDMPGGSGASPAWIEQAVQDSLRRLDTDYIDLYIMHRPDADTPVEATMETLDALVRAGTVRAVGCSNVTAEWIDETMALAAEREVAGWVSVQNHYSLLHREPEEDGVLAACARYGLGVLPYFPLASGMLTGKYRAGEDPPEGTRLGTIPAERAARFMGAEAFAAVARLEQYARERERSLLELAFGYLLSRSEVASVIAGATKPEQIAANVAAGSWRLETDEVAEVAGIAGG